VPETVAVEVDVPVSLALGWMISMWQRGLASMKRVNEIFLAEPSIDGALVGGASLQAEEFGAIVRAFA